MINRSDFPATVISDLVVQLAAPAALPHRRSRAGFLFLSFFFQPHSNLELFLKPKTFTSPIGNQERSGGTRYHDVTKLSATEIDGDDRPNNVVGIRYLFMGSKRNSQRLSGPLPWVVHTWEPNGTGTAKRTWVCRHRGAETGPRARPICGPGTFCN